MKEDKRSESSRIRAFAHDIRTPLTSIIGFTQLISSGDALNLSREKLMEYSRNVEAASRSLLAICEEVIDEAVHQEPKSSIEIVDFKSLGLELAEHFNEKARTAGVHFELDTDYDMPTLLTDPMLLKQVFLGIVDTAISLTPSGGNVQLRPRIARDGQAMFMTVQDKGRGFPAHVLMRLVSGAMSDLHSAKISTDWNRILGLLRPPVAQLGGELGLHAEEGHGSVTYLKMPLAPPKVAEAG